MVITGGIVGSCLLILVIYAVLHFRYRRLSKEFVPGLAYDLVLWISILSILGVATLGIAKFIN